MGQRQNGQEHIVAVNGLRFPGRQYVGAEITVRQHHAFGGARRARSVNQAGQIIRERCLDAAVAGVGSVFGLEDAQVVRCNDDMEFFN